MKVLVMPGHLPAALRRRVKATTVGAVIRRLFRIGLLLGLLAGVAFALTKLLAQPGSRRAGALAARPSEPWPRLTADPTAAGAADRPTPIPDPGTRAAAPRSRRRAPASGSSPPAACAPPATR